MKFNGWFLLLSIISVACNTKEKQTREGLAIAKKKCSTCHEFVDASVLNRDTWLAYILPEMAVRAKLNDEEYRKVEEYYALLSPNSLIPSQPPEKIVRDNWLFDALVPTQKTAPLSSTTLVTVDSLTGVIYTSNSLEKKLYRWDKDLKPIDTFAFTSAISDAIFINESQRQVIFTALGDIMPNESTEGIVLKYNLNTNNLELVDTIASALPRPVASAAADLNNDGLTDYLTCGFGHEKGGLFITWQQKDNTYKTQKIVSIAGPDQLYVQDFNNDGWNDFIVLFSNAEESIRLFINNRNGSFTMQKLINFLPVAGSSSFQVIDINKDSLPDIIYTSGDNSDLSKIFKPFHGLYIYINQGNFKYKQEYFFPINGCTKAIASDLDNDGDLDIATIAFFADFNNNSAEKCILLEQDRPLHFKPHSPDIDLLGRWLCMEIADYDNDGHKDIILGNFSQGLLNFPVVKNKWDKRNPFIVLKNMRK